MGGTRLSYKQRIEICRALESGIGTKTVSKKFNVSVSTPAVVYREMRGTMVSEMRERKAEKPIKGKPVDVKALIKEFGGTFEPFDEGTEWDNFGLLIVPYKDKDD